MEKLVLVQKAISKVFGDFVAKAVSDSVDVVKDAIKDADLDRKSYNQNLQTRLYQFIVDALNRFTYNKYEKQDKLYDAAESIIKGYIRTQDNVDAVKSGLKMLVSGVNNDTCQEFLETLCGEICRDDNSDLYKEIDMLWKRQESEYFRGEFAKIGQNDREILERLNDLKEVLDFIKRNMNRQEDKLGHDGFPIVNRADEYAKKWDKNVFLNDFNKRDKNAGVNIKLKELYLEKHLPHYKWKSDDESSTDLKELLREYIVDNDDKKMLLILGQAGIGKSTLITWVMANLVEKKDDILVYQFATDLKNINWQNDSILDEIFAAIGLEYYELEGKTLILDGFDEICVKGDRERILYKMNQELEKKNFLKTFSIIVTCRENYVDKVRIEGIEHITLQTWNEGQIKSFCEIYEEVFESKNLGSRVNKNLEIKINKIIEKGDIMGIPLILYMLVALNVDVERGSSIVDIYDQIFSLKRGGIYDRGYDVEHRINEPETKRHIHHISQKIAFWMFENNADEATIPQENFEEICENEMIESGEKSEEIQSNTLIGNFFRLKYCEGERTDELQFVHRSIYEYFVVLYFFESVCNLTSKEELAGKLGELLKDGQLSLQLLEFIKYKFNSVKRYNLASITEEVFQTMIRDGMTYYVNIRYKNIVEREMKIFSNMLEIVLLWNSKLGMYDNSIVVYLRYNHERKLNLKGIMLKMPCLVGVNLSEANLSGAFLPIAKLSRAKLSGADLSGANLSGADLSGADLKRANLVGARLLGADLTGADLTEADLTGAELSVANLERAILSRAKLLRVNLTEAMLSRVDLVGANLSGANLTKADLTRADLTGADVWKENLTFFDFVDMDNLFVLADKPLKPFVNLELLDINLFDANLDRTIFSVSGADYLCEIYDLSTSLINYSEVEGNICYEEYCIRRQQE